MFTDVHDTDTAKFGNVKVQNSVRLKYKLYNAMLKVSSFWRGLSWSTKLDSWYTSEERNRGHSFPLSLLCHVALTNTYISNTHTLRCDSIVITLLRPGEECHLDFSPKSCTYPTLVTTDPQEVKIISILLFKNNNCPMLFFTFTNDNSSFLTTVKKKKSCISLFSIQKFLNL